jgi:hypothetical protein
MRHLEIIRQTRVEETPLCCFWKDNSDILHIVVKSKGLNAANIRDNFEAIKNLVKEKKTKVVIDVSSCQPMDIDDRFIIERQCSEMFDTMAFVSDTMLGTVIASSLIQQKSSEFKAKYFGDKQLAVQWLKDT